MAKLQMVPMRNGDLPEWKPPQNTKHAASVISELGRNMHEHAYLVGRTLLWVKKEIGRGKFLSWIESNLWFGERTAQGMMKFASRCIRAGTALEYHGIKSKSELNSDLPSPTRKKTWSVKAACDRLTQALDKELEQANDEEKVILGKWLQMLSFHLVKIKLTEDEGG